MYYPTYITRFALFNERVYFFMHLYILDNILLYLFNVLIQNRIE